jgi:hypothetical protein
MEEVPPQSPREVFTDIRGGDRTMRVSYHSDREVVVVSLWLDGLCRASFRMAAGDVERFTSALQAIRPAAVEPDPATPSPAPDDPPEGVDATGVLAMLGS